MKKRRKTRRRRPAPRPSDVRVTFAPTAHGKPSPRVVATWADLPQPTGSGHTVRVEALGRDFTDTPCTVVMGFNTDPDARGAWLSPSIKS